MIKTQIYLILYLQPDDTGKPIIRCHEETYDNPASGDLAASRLASAKGAKAWLYGVERPPLIELAPKDMRRL